MARDSHYAPIRWIGVRSIDCRRHPAPQKVWPVRIAAGAFGDGCPSRDVFLSPDHSVYALGVLIPVRLLCNGSSIAQVERDTVDYYHVELPSHDVLFAEGLPTESYLDTGDRGNFSNGGRHVVLYPDLTALKWKAGGCAPLAVTGPVLDAVRLVVAQAARLAAA